MTTTAGVMSGVNYPWRHYISEYNYTAISIIFINVPIYNEDVQNDARINQI